MHKRVVLNRRDEMPGEVLGGHDRVVGLEGEVLDHVDLELQNDADEAVATHRQPEQLLVLGPRAVDDRPVRQHQPQRAHRGAERPVGHRPAVRVDAERGGDAEVVVGLHDRRREADRIERGDHLLPADAGVDQIGPGGRVRLTARAVEREGDAVARQALAAHRMPGRSDGDRAALGGSRLELLAQPGDEVGLLVGLHDPMAKHRRRAQAARVVEDDAGLCRGNLGKRGIESSDGAGLDQAAPRDAGDRLTHWFFPRPEMPQSNPPLALPWHFSGIGPRLSTMHTRQHLL